MTGLWEPVGGVFWSTPPAVPDELWSYLPVIPVLAVAVIAGLKVWQRIKVKRQQPDWKLRQHMVEIGTAITVAYLFAMLVLVCVRGSQVLTMPLNEVGDFLAGAFGPVAFLWLVLGFLQQGEELRIQATELKNSVAQQAIMAEAAMKQAEAQRDAHVRGLLANFAIQMDPESTYLENGTYTNGLKFRNDGNIARNVSILFSPKFPSVTSEWFGDMKHGDEREVAIKTDFNEPYLKGEIFIEYEDVESTPRLETFIYRYNGGFIEFEKMLLPEDRESGAGVPAQ